MLTILAPLARNQERSDTVDVFSFPDKAQAPSGSSTANTRDVQSFSCPAAVLCANPIWRRDWRKTSFLRRSPMPRGQAWQSKQGSPFQPPGRSLLRTISRSSGVRAIPADHDVYPWGDEPSGAMIQTEPSSPSLAGGSKSPSGPVFSSQCQQNRQTLRDKSHKAANLFFLFG